MTQWRLISWRTHEPRRSLPDWRRVMTAVLWMIPVVTAVARPMELEDLFRARRVSDPKVSADGRWVVCVVGEVLKDDNRVDTDLWLVPTDGGEPRRLTSGPKHDRHPTWSPDGRWIAFESNRDGEYQIWVIARDGGEARRLTALSTGASQPVWSPDGGSLAFVSAVFPEFSDKPFAEAERLNKERLETREKSKVKARVLTRLLYRHWDSWVDDRRQHLMVLPVRDGAAAGEPRNVTPGDRDAIPTSSTFSAGDDFAFSPDGRKLAYTATPLPAREEAWSTNHDVWEVDLETMERKALTTNAAADAFPRYSPDGKVIAYRAQARSGYEADRWGLWLLDRSTGARRELAPEWDRSVDGFAWLADGSGMILEAEESGGRRIWYVEASGGVPRPLTSRGAAGEISSAGGGQVWVTISGMTRPPEVAGLDVRKGGVLRTSTFNQRWTEGLELREPESVTVSGAGGTPVQMWILKPPGFDEKRRYPMVFWVHGGPQGAHMDAWSTRWNASLWAAQGYVLALPNPRGSTGFGQTFVDQIRHDWGGRVFDDLMAALAFMERQPYVDTGRMVAAGASFGGYMMNWFQGHTDRFRALVNHCGVYNFTTMYGTTEELWFDEWEHGIPWESPEFEKYSPHRHAARFRTPMLIIHNELDFRVPVSQGMDVFTTLQRKGVPSRFVYFPDEGHWVLKPQNSDLWHREVFAWLGTYLR